MNGRPFFDDNKPLERALVYFVKSTSKRLTDLGLKADPDEIRARLLLTTLEARATFKEDPSGQSARASLYTYINRAMQNQSYQIIREAVKERSVFDHDFELDPERIVDPGASYAVQEALYVQDIRRACNEPERVVMCELMNPSAHVVEEESATTRATTTPKRGRPASYRDHMAGCIAKAHGMKVETVSYHMRNVKRKIGEVVQEN